MNKFIIPIKILIFLTLAISLNSCEALKYKPTKAGEVPINVKDRVKKNIEEGKGFRLMGGNKKGGTFDFASSNELWRATLDMGDSGKLVFSGASVTPGGIHMVNDIVPAADTPVYSMTDSATAYGIARGAGASSNLSYTITFDDFTASAEMMKGAGTDRSFGVKYTGVEGLTIGFASGENKTTKGPEPHERI